MKSPHEWKGALRRQWESADWRASRLLNSAGAWPIELSIGRPAPQTLSKDLDSVKRHVAAWRQIQIGEVVWKSISYRATGVPVEIPVCWILRMPTEWLEACGDSSMRQEWDALAMLVDQTDSLFHTLFVRQRSLWRGKSLGEVVQAAQLAMKLMPGCACGRPLRMLSMAGIDTKFFERHASLITKLLDLRFDGEVSQLGLERFLGALVEGDHWLLVVDLDGSLLPFSQIRVRSSELHETPLPGNRLLIVENEACQHLLPALPHTIAVLGAGFDLQWTSAHWLSTKQVAYWGDIDTWGLQLLAQARAALGEIRALMMTAEIFEQFAASAVAEPVVASAQVPSHLNDAEQSLYRRLLNEPRGRLEQEFLPQELTRSEILQWANHTPLRIN